MGNKGIVFICKLCGKEGCGSEDGILCSNCVQGLLDKGKEKAIVEIRQMQKNGKSINEEKLNLIKGFWGITINDLKEDSYGEPNEQNNRFRRIGKALRHNASAIGRFAGERA